MAYIFLTGGLFFAFQAVRLSTRGRPREWQLALSLRGVRIRHRPARAASRGGRRLRRATGIRPARLPDPQQGARRQQGRPHQRHLERAYRVRCGADDPPECRPDCNRRFRRGTAPHQDTAAQGLPFRRTSAGSAGPAGAAVADNPVEPPKPALTLPDKPSIAVLPFTNMSSDPEQEYFADGMVEEITTALSRFKSLFVIAANPAVSPYSSELVDIGITRGEIDYVASNRGIDPRGIRSAEWARYLPTVDGQFGPFQTHQCPETDFR